MEYTMENFKDGKFIIACRKEDEAEKLMEILALKDIKWSGGQIATAQTYWDVHKEKTCYETSKWGLLYGYYNEFEKSSPVIEFSELEHSQKSKKEKVLEIIGVKIGEPFNVVDSSYNPHVFDENFNLLESDGDKADYKIINILWGKNKIEKIPQDSNIEVKKHIESISNKYFGRNNMQEAILFLLNENLSQKESKSA